MIKIIYKVEVRGIENFQDSGPVIIASNHISFIDPLILCVCANRPPFSLWIKHTLILSFYSGSIPLQSAIPITPRKICPDGLERAMSQAKHDLHTGETLAIFPEGFISKDGELMDFKEGIKRLGEEIPELNLYPVAISGMWGSWFSRHKNGRAMNGLPWRRSFRTKLSVSVGKPIKGPDIIPSIVRKQVEVLRGPIK